MEELDVSIVYQSGMKHSDADRLNRTPVDPPPEDSDEDGAFFRVVTESGLAAQQRTDPELRVIIHYLK